MDIPKLKIATASLHAITSPVKTCYLGKLYFLGKGRTNCYGPSLKFTRGEVGSLFLTQREIEQYIEPRRKKGTYWEIYDLPCIVLEATGSPRLVISGTGIDIDSLSDFKPVLPPSLKFGNLAKALMGQTPKYIYAFQTSHHIPVASFPFIHKRSISAESIQASRDIGEPLAPSKKIQFDTHGKWGWPQSAIKLVCQICLWASE